MLNVKEDKEKDDWVITLKGYLDQTAEVKDFFKGGIFLMFEDRNYKKY